MAKHQCGTCWNEYDCGKACEHKGFYLMCAQCKKRVLESPPHATGQGPRLPRRGTNR